MIQTLTILGLLKKNPASGYDIKKFIENDLKIFFDLENKSIYYSLQQMEKSRLITCKELKGKAALKKYVYTITSLGKKRFSELSRKVLLSNKRPFIESDIGLYFLPFINKNEVLSVLRLRIRFLGKVKQWLDSKYQELNNAPKNLNLLIKHHFQLAEAETLFLKDMLVSVKKGDINFCNTSRRPK